MESLRSQLAKNAIMTLNVLFNELQKDMDPFLDQSLQMMLKKAGETNAFIAE